MDFLLSNAVGRNNAQPWSAIEEYLEKHGHHVRQQSFQQKLLKQSREGELFIGSCDHGTRGYFLIRDKADADVMRDWYARRIAVETRHFDHLESLIKRAFPP